MEYYGIAMDVVIIQCKADNGQWNDELVSLWCGQVHGYRLV